MSFDTVLSEAYAFVGACEHPWLCIERLMRALAGERVTRGASTLTDGALVAAMAESVRIERAGWFN